MMNISQSKDQNTLKRFENIRILYNVTFLSGIYEIVSFKHTDMNKFLCAYKFVMNYIAKNLSSQFLSVYASLPYLSRRGNRS